MKSVKRIRKKTLNLSFLDPWFCSMKFSKINRKTYMPESLFKQSCSELFSGNKYISLRLLTVNYYHKKAPCNLLKKKLGYRCFPVNFKKHLRTSFFTAYPWTTVSDKSYKFKLSADSYLLLCPTFAMIFFCKIS